MNRLFSRFFSIFGFIFRQMETVLVSNSMNGMTEKPTPCDLELEGIVLIL
ncbi:unnamed protein product [Schistosoma curassoni]|uniref:Uncharacterized protein n=1 Tax=Schistosoma curassoni TaxID=6186 RepID=A0A183JT72_9TREM|nr:unnamed protein product [Schistosoma curassoni]